MAILSTKGLTVQVQKGSATGTELTPTDISKAEPAVVTVADTTGMSQGDFVTMAGTSFTELDGKQFIVGAVTATTFELLGSNTTGSGATLGGTPTATYYTTADLQGLCLSSITVNNPEAGTISVGTFCNPGASVPGNPTAGSLTLSGYVDIQDQGYLELLTAEDDGLPRGLKITIPSNGYLVASIIVGSVTWDLPLEGAAGYSFNCALETPMEHITS